MTLSQALEQFSVPLAYNPHTRGLQLASGARTTSATSARNNNHGLDEPGDEGIIKKHVEPVEDEEDLKNGKDLGCDDQGPSDTTVTSCDDKGPSDTTTSTTASTSCEVDND